MNIFSPYLIDSVVFRAEEYKKALSQTHPNLFIYNEFLILFTRYKEQE
jgi:hypothetical protein